MIARGRLQTIVTCTLAAILSGCIPLRMDRAPGATVFTERVFQKRDTSGARDFTVRIRATRRVNPEFLQILERELRVIPVNTTSTDELAFWRDHQMPLIASRAEIQVELIPADSGVDVRGYLFTWPDMFRVSRPGVLEVRPEYRNVRVGKDDIREIRQALGSLSNVRGRLMCNGSPVRQAAVVAGGQKGQSRDDGTFEIAGPFGNNPITVYVAYDANIQVGSPTDVTPHYQIIDDFHFTRNESITKRPGTSNGVANFGDVPLDGNDCTLWNFGVRALHHYFAVMKDVPPAGELRVKRWSAVYISAGAGVHTFYNYLVVPTDLVSGPSPDQTFFHEFGHSIRHVADGNETHWHWDDFRFNYGHRHNRTQVWNKGFAFNEGWANYWSSVVRSVVYALHSQAPPADHLEWSEDRIGQYLRSLAVPTSHEFMINVLRSNPGTIHTLYDFEEKYCAALGPAKNHFCSDGRPLRPQPASCPPNYFDDGATCRLNNIVSKPSSGRGAGIPPTACGPDREYDTGLCYPLCPSGFRGIGPVCWEYCPPDYADDGVTCRRDAHIFGADNSACPWYDKCGLTFAEGCSVCPAEYANDGCSCRRDVHIFAKSSSTRNGSVPDGCPAGMEYDTGLCYWPCPMGYTGRGPFCWGACPPGYADHGATCHQLPHVFSDD